MDCGSEIRQDVRGTIEYGVDIPYTGEGIRYSKEESMDVLTEEFRDLAGCLECGLHGEAEDQLRWILDGVKEGRYDVEDEIKRKLCAAMDKLMEAMQCQ